MLLVEQRGEVLQVAASLLLLLVEQRDEVLQVAASLLLLLVERARMVDDVAAYPWSSYGLRADWLKEPNWLDMDPCFIELGQTAEEADVADKRRITASGYSPYGVGTLSGVSGVRRANNAMGVIRRCRG